VKRRYFTVVNGAAGGGRCRSRFDKVKYRLEREGFTLDARLTSHPGHATELVREAFARGERDFLAVGGDGTSYEIVNGLFPEALGEEVTLATLPLGTGNSFMRDFGITTEAHAIEALREGKSHAVDVVKLTHASGALHYINLLGLGFTARAGKLTNDKWKPYGALGYVGAVLVSVADLAYATDAIRLEGAPEADARPAVFLCFCNSKFTGGAMMMAPAANVSDGKLDVIRVGALTRSGLVGQFPRIFTGHHVDHPLVETKLAARVDFVEDHVQPCMIDGEIIELAPRSLEVLPSVLRVIA
jgi:diacylglycerol kinase (ATP)